MSASQFRTLPDGREECLATIEILPCPGEWTNYSSANCEHCGHPHGHHYLQVESDHYAWQVGGCSTCCEELEAVWTIDDA